MATEKIGIYRNYYGPVPKDSSGKPLPKSYWPRKRAYSWVVRWFGTDEQRYSRSFKTRKEANRFAETKQSDVKNGRVDAPANIGLKEFAEEHANLMKGQIAEKTLREDGRVLRYLLEIVGNRALAKISAQHAEMYVNRRSETGVSPSTINKEIRILRRIFTLAADRRGYLPEGQNCFKKVAKRKVSQKALRYVSVGEFRRLLAATPNLKWQLFLSLLYTTGLRVDEARHLTWSDIDFEQGILHVSAKRGVKVLVPWEPKDHELRHIPACRELLNLITHWQAEAPERVPYVFLTAERYAFIVDQVRTGGWHEAKALTNNVLRSFNVIRRRAGVARCTLHDFRRSCITNWARRLPAHVVRKLAGHASLETTMKYYLAVEESDLEKARDIGTDLLVNSPLNGMQKNLKSDATDQKLTNSARFGPKSQLRKKQGTPQHIEEK